MNNLKTDKKQVAPLFRKMSIGESVDYPSVQKSSLESTRTRLQTQYPPIKFSIVKITDYHIRVTRTN